MRIRRDAGAWLAVLDAVDAEDYETANRIMTAYKFAERTRQPANTIKRYAYQWENPTGERGIADDAKQLSLVMGITPQSIWGKFTREEGDSVEWMKGSACGWKVTRVPKQDEIRVV